MDYSKEVFVVTAPSGTGKTTLNQKIIEKLPEVAISISLTTRAKREGEENGVHYWFVDQAEFDKNVHSGKMLEWAEIYGNFYGTTEDELKRIASKNQKAILEIDVQGWLNSKEKLPLAKSIFIMPPSMQVLWERLKNRGTDTHEVQLKRIGIARHELSYYNYYDYFIINDDLDTAYEELKSVFNGTPKLRLNREQGAAYCLKLMEEADQAQWV